MEIEKDTFPTSSILFNHSTQIQQRSGLGSFKESQGLKNIANQRGEQEIYTYMYILSIVSISNEFQ